MNIAYLINNNGEIIKLNSDDDNCINYKNKLICPCCGEQVKWFNGQKMVRHFRHQHGTYRKECENYCSSISTGIDLFPYERQGLDLYLIKELGGFSLKIGLTAVNSKSIKEADRIGLVVNIENNKETIASKDINFEYFIPDEMNFIGINNVCEQYKLKFSKQRLLQERLPQEIKMKWNENINGIGMAGAVFSSCSYGGKKITTSKSIILNEEYLLLTPNKDGYRNIKGASFDKIQEIDFGWLNKYYLFKFILTEKNYFSLEFAKKFDFELKYKHEEIIPIWPPCSIIEDELTYNMDGEIFFTFSTDNPIPNEFYSHKLKGKLTSQYFEDGKYLVNSCIKTNDYISIESSYSTINYSIAKKSDLINKIEPNIEIKFLNNIVNVSTDVKLFVNLYLDKYLLKSEIITSENYSIAVRRGQKIEILYGLDIIWENSNESKMNVLEDNNQKDKELLFRIKNCKGESISTPTNLKWQIFKLKNYDLSYKELIRIVQCGKLPVKLINLIKDSI